MTTSTLMATVLSALVGVGAGVLVQRAATRFVPAGAPVPVAVGAGGAGSGGGGGSAGGAEPAMGLEPVLGAEPAVGTESMAAVPRSVSLRVPPTVTVAATAVLCGLAGMRFGATWQLPAFLLLAAVGVLLAVIDLEHRLLPNRVLLPATSAAAALLTCAAGITGSWSRLAAALACAAGLFLFFFVLALLAPAGLGMGDVKLAGFLGLYLGWVGPGALAVGAVAGFVVQAALAMALLAARKVGVKGEIPFGPALLAGAAIAIGWGPDLVSAWLGTTGRM